jgi:hypothetical protein
MLCNFLVWAFFLDLDFFFFLSQPYSSQMKEAERKATIAKRLYDAVSIVIDNANNEELNGTYDPIDDVVDEWPCYRKRDGTAEIWMTYEASSSSWVIKRGKVSYAIIGKPEIILQNGYLARLRSNPPTFPELRFEGVNGVEEVNDPSLDSSTHSHSPQRRKGKDEKEIQMTSVSRLTVITEAEWKAMRDLQAMKTNGM